MPAETVVRLGAPLLRHPGRDDRLPVRRRRGDLRDREVPVDRERQRPRDRGGGHVEDVRAPPLRQGGTLLHAEAVLLVDHGDREVGELDLALDERVRADGDAHVARRHELVRRAALARREARGQEGDADPQLGAETLDRQEMLLGERLRGRHQRALTAAFDGAEQRVERDRRLARPDVPLEQPLHGRRQREVAVDLGDRVLLGRREGERQRLPVARDELRRRRQRLGDEHLPLGGAASQRQLEREQLVEGQAPASPLRLLLRARAMEANQGVRAQRQALGRSRACRQRLASVADEGERRVRDGAQRLLRQVCRRRVDRREVRGLDGVADVVRGDLEPEAVRLAPEPESCAGDELRLEPRLVEPGRPDLAGCVGHVGGEDVEPSAPSRRGASHDDVEDRLLVPEQLRDRPLLGRRLVAARSVGQHVPDRRDPEPAQLSPDGRPDARQRLHGPLERLGARDRARPGEARGRVQPGKAGVGPGAWRRGRHRDRVYGRGPDVPGLSPRLGEPDD